MIDFATSQEYDYLYFSLLIFRYRQAFESSSALDTRPVDMSAKGLPTQPDPFKRIAPPPTITPKWMGGPHMDSPRDQPSASSSDPARLGGGQMEPPRGTGSADRHRLGANKLESTKPKSTNSDKNVVPSQRPQNCDNINELQRDALKRRSADQTQSNQRVPESSTQGHQRGGAELSHRDRLSGGERFTGSGGKVEPGRSKETNGGASSESSHHRSSSGSGGSSLGIKTGPRPSNSNERELYSKPQTLVPGLPSYPGYSPSGGGAVQVAPPNYLNDAISPHLGYESSYQALLGYASSPYLPGMAGDMGNASHRYLDLDSRKVTGVSGTVGASARTGAVREPLESKPPQQATTERPSSGSSSKRKRERSPSSSKERRVHRSGSSEKESDKQSSSGTANGTREGGEFRKDETGNLGSKEWNSSSGGHSSPLTLRHLHTHHHTHVVGAAYPLYGSYSGNQFNSIFIMPINSSQEQYRSAVINSIQFNLSIRDEYIK